MFESLNKMVEYSKLSNIHVFGTSERKLIHEVVVNSKKINYTIKIYSKFTFLCGDSGTGKTTLVSMISSVIDGSIPSNIIKISSGAKVSASYMRFGNINNFKIFLDTCGDIVFLDEDCFDTINQMNAKRLLDEYDKYFVIVSRDVFINRSLLYSTDDLFIVKNSGKYNYLEKLFKEDNALPDNIRVDKIITEDSKSGFYFMRSIFGDDNVIPGTGANSIEKKIADIKCNSVLLLVYDSLSVRILELDIRIMLKVKKMSAFIFRPLSIERYFLDSEFLDNLEFEDNVLIGNLEDYYEKVLSSVLPAGYSKGSECKCLLEDCSKMKSLDYSKCSNCLLGVFSKSKKNLTIHSGLEKVELI